MQTSEATGDITGRSVMGSSRSSLTLKELSVRNGKAERNRHGLKRCPACGEDGAKNWLQAPDRFHGRPAIYQLIRCSACSLVWLDNPPSLEEMGDHYGPDYHRLIETAGENSPERWRVRVETLLRYKRSGALLDLGCSSGAFLEGLKGPSWDLHGIEISASSAKKAEARSGARVFVGDIFAAPFPPETFDAITCFDVLEHLHHPREVMAKVAEWLKPGGIFYTFIPNIEAWEARIFRSYWYALELPRHLFHYSPTSLRHLSTSVGLQEVSLYTSWNSSMEYSIRYLYDEILRGLGFSRVPVAAGGTPSLAWKVVRKILRFTALAPLSGLASFAGSGESIYAVFRKEAPGLIAGFANPPGSNAVNHCKSRGSR